MRAGPQRLPPGPRGPLGWPGSVESMIGRQGLRILWSSVIPWSRPTAEGHTIIPVGSTTSDRQLAVLVEQPFVFFFEPTPYPALGHDPVVLASRIAALTRSRNPSDPIRPGQVTAFIEAGSPEPLETQAAFAFQVGVVLGVKAGFTTLVPRQPVSPESTKAKMTAARQGPDWGSAVSAIAGHPDAQSDLPARSTLLAAAYLAPDRQGFNPTQRRLLYRAATGEVAIVAKDIAADLFIQKVTAQRAITEIARHVGEIELGRNSPDFVAQLVVQHRWFLSYNPA